MEKFKLHRKKKKSFKKWLTTLHHVSLNPTATSTKDEVIESLYDFFKRHKQSKIIFTTKGK